MKRSICAILVVSILVACFSLPILASDGATFRADTIYKTSIVPDAPILTFEATLTVPRSLSGRGGVILGNFGATPCCYSFEVYSGGNPRLYLVDQQGKVTDKVFTSVNLRTGEKTHLAIVREGDRLLCYVNGEMKQSLAIDCPTPVPAVPAVLGGDLRSGNAQYFKGTLHSVLADTEARDAATIARDAAAFSAEGALMAYELTSLSDRIVDQSGNGYDLMATRTWFTDKEPVTDFAYSLAIVGDTQIICESHPDKYNTLYGWIRDNVEGKRIAAVLSMGDITNSSTEKEWNLAKAAFASLDDVVPYTLVRGNHDTPAAFHKAFPYEQYADRLGGSYNGTMSNTWQTLTVGKVQYLILCLDYGASDEVLDWAGGVIEDHPEHNVIVTTHAYLYRDGTTLDQGDVCPPAISGGHNNGDHIWEKLIRKHENITLVLSGHDPSDRVVAVQTKGDHGNTVTQILVDPQGVDAAQGGTGMITMLYFSSDGTRVTAETYSTAKKQFFMTENQFTLTVDTVGGEEQTTAPVTDLQSEDAAQSEDAQSDKAPAADGGCGSVISPLPAVLVLGALLLACGRNDINSMRYHDNERK